MSGDVLVVTKNRSGGCGGGGGRVLLESTEQRPRMVINILQNTTRIIWPKMSIVLRLRR